MRNNELKRRALLTSEKLVNISEREVKKKVKPREDVRFSW